MKISIIGSGFVGTALGKGLIELGNEVIFYDIIDKDMPNFTFTKDINHAIESTNISFICVPTPTTPEGIDLSYIKEVAKNIVGLDPRIGKYGSVHGKAFGGECLPKDLKAFVSFADKYRNVRLLKAVDEINEEIREKYGVRE
ncbi:UDP-glucose 6-dehydrogenase AglM [ANME-1 cluster archaeon GoMg1]|nr:UDP-glucose 6-dehydrogenase AglM [ANME-1 cluster archaeon GoMg1]